MYMKDIIYPPSGRALPVEAAIRAATWFGNHTKELGEDYSLTDVGELAIQIYEELIEELEKANGYKD